MEENEIDIVITWVDGSNTEWIQELSKYSDKPLDKLRFEDTGTLKYVFRSIEKFLPWVRNVYLITPGYFPSWINSEHRKLKLISQDDLYKDKSVLPIFNSCSVEMNLHRIEGLSEQFIYFCDDMIIQKKLNKSYFFKNGKVNDYFIVRSLFHDALFSHQMHSQMQIINNEIRKDKSLKKQFINTLSIKYGFKNMINSFMLFFFAKKEIPLLALNHHPQAHLKSNFIELEKAYPEILERTIKARFRTEYQISQTVFRFWGLIKGKFNPTYHNDAKYIGVNDLDTLKVQLNKLKNSNISMICLNEDDGFPTDKYEEYKKILRDFLDIYLNEKSLYEK